MKTPGLYRRPSRIARLLSSAGLVSVGLAAACGSSSPTAPSIQALAIVGGPTDLSQFTPTGQLSAIQTLSSGATQDVSGQATWSSSDPTAASVTATGFLQAVGVGATTISATYHGVSAAARVTVSAVTDCDPYNAGSLQILQIPDGWSLRDNIQLLFLFDNAGDGADALALARRYSQLCQIGRDSRRSNRLAYIVDYWQGPTGAQTTIQSEDCQSYNPSNLRTVNAGSIGWTLTDGTTQVALLDNSLDAGLALTLAQGYHAHCYIGRNNTRSNPLDYMMQYWK